MTRDEFQDGKVVPLRARAGEPGFASIERVETYWEALRDGRLMPARAEVDPRGLSSALEHAFLLEKIAPGLARIRLAGMHLNDLMAMEVRGMPITTMFLPEARDEMQRVLAEVLETPAAVRLALCSDTGFARSRLVGRMILLPLRDDTGTPSRILGALQTRGEIGRHPRRLLIQDIETKALTGDPRRAGHPPRVRPEVWRDTTPADRPAEAPGLSSKARDWARRIARATAKADSAGGHLRLVYDADARA